MLSSDQLEPKLSESNAKSYAQLISRERKMHVALSELKLDQTNFVHEDATGPVIWDLFPIYGQDGQTISAVSTQSASW